MAPKDGAAAKGGEGQMPNKIRNEQFDEYTNGLIAGDDKDTSDDAAEIKTADGNSISLAE